jgi:Tfp pilus assembly protein PilF
VSLALRSARILYRQKQLEAALEVVAPSDGGTRLPEVRGARALLWLDLGGAVRAAAEVEHALTVDPGQREAGIVRGTVALWSRPVQEYTAVFERVLAKHPESGRAWLGLSQDVVMRGDVQRARTLLERAAERMPDYIGTWHALAWCQLMQRDLAAQSTTLTRLSGWTAPLVNSRRPRAGSRAVR